MCFIIEILIHIRINRKNWKTYYHDKKETEQIERDRTNRKRQECMCERKKDTQNWQVRERKRVSRCS